MAKRKRSSRRKSSSTNANTAVADSQEPSAAATDQAAERFVGQWNRLISTTNWEKGRIICQWREQLISAEASVTEYSDETWSQLVGGVTSQHVGRLRRVFERFGDVSDQYEGLYWSHFQAALDWDDAEMWLEGAIQNGWSVSQMRGKRWETLGTPREEQEAELQQDQQSLEFPTASGEGANSSRSPAQQDLQPVTAKTSTIEPSSQPSGKQTSKTDHGSYPEISGSSRYRLTTREKRDPADRGCGVAPRRSGRGVRKLQTCHHRPPP